MFQGTDVFVIGGGPAGLAAALAARQRGLTVTVADGAEPPIEKACGEGLMPDALAALRALGVSLSESEGVAFRGIRFLEGPSGVQADFPTGRGIGLRRLALHRKMVEQARDAGVSLLWKTPVSALCAEGVVAGGKVVRSRWVVGADGMRSRVRGWVGLEGQAKQEWRYALRRHYRVKPWSDRIEIHWGANSQAYVTPVGEREVCAVLISRKPGSHFASIGAEFPELAARLGTAELGGPERGAITTTRRLTRVHRGRVALIGDASGSVDAITGQGLSLGFQQAAALADAFAVGDLRSYELAHRRLAFRPALMGRLMLRLDSQPWLRKRAMRALVANPEVFARLLALHVGVGSPAYAATTGALFGWRLVAAL
jgi:menaquinone-9 beta-reductase